GSGGKDPRRGRSVGPAADRESRAGGAGMAGHATIHRPPPAIPRGSVLRVFSWVLHVAIPAATLWLLVALPELDVVWDHRIAHFGLVLAAAAVAVTLAAVMGRAARGRRDARLFLVSLAFGVSAGFLGAHAMATPGVLLAAANAGFVAATPIGLLLGGVAALASSVEFSPAGAARLLHRQRVLSAAPWVLPAGWVVASLVGLPVLAGPPGPVETAGVPLLAAIVGGFLYALAALRYLRVYRRRPSTVLLSMPDRVRAAGAGLVRDRVRPQLAPVVVGVARPDGAGVRVHRLRRARAVPP
ncbi:MAG: hypothetical protein L0K86_16635, partial [Actinomycetia bacterium]|nr:hypothetical protein [Actinomycetes bacterium]